MYPLIPYKRLLIRTSLTPDDAAQILAQTVIPRSKWFPFWSRATSAFEGRVSPEGFNINRGIRYRNSFLPILHGRFRQTSDGTLVDVRMTMHPTVILFLLFWYVIIAIALFEFAEGVAHDAPVSARDWIPLGVLVFIYMMCFIAFGFEADRATRMLKEIFGAT